MFDAWPPEWRITAYYLLALFATVAAAKLASVILAWNSWPTSAVFVFVAPALSVDTWSRVRPLTAPLARSVWIRSVLVMAALASCVVMIHAGAEQFPWAVRGYLAIVPFWLLTEFLSSLAQLIFLPARWYIPPVHEEPWRSRTLAEFWGQRWNRVFGDWFRQICFQPFRGRPAIGLWVSFGVSALMHEFVVNLPLWAAYRKNLFGSMFAYFTIQAAGILIERRFLRHTVFNRLFLWLCVLGPAPLVLNEGTLRIFHFLTGPAP